ncbi:26S proteasome regulatory subunit 7 [Camellia lanceoleosa]|uniref:26S proteasome regulatory subunit 7 n=1 Tax=Camellia lanceoleosa TaxID=1840588 RepID=A0ACC0IK44_9ERIC|nr:26S proteasome regulatory subunit 7 [Camellia lanceoleosa]
MFLLSIVLQSLQRNTKLCSSLKELSGPLNTELSSKLKKEYKAFFLREMNDPEKFVNLGIDPPKGVLCYGPPGTGKTLLARAVANRTDACFIRVIGSELVKKYVGEGARLVRELFQMARSKKACIVFFDELDAIGGARFDDGEGGDNEFQRTMLEIVNQLDGFDARGNIKVLMATNRPDTLNPSVTSGSVVGAIRLYSPSNVSS